MASIKFIGILPQIFSTITIINEASYLSISRKKSLFTFKQKKASSQNLIAIPLINHYFTNKSIKYNDENLFIKLITNNSIDSVVIVYDNVNRISITVCSFLQLLGFSHSPFISISRHIGRRNCCKTK